MKIVKDKKIVISSFIFLFVCVLAISYALFTQSLNINGTGINRKSNFDIYFNNVSNFLTTGTASVANSTPTNQNHTTVIEDYEATLATPGDSVYFIFDIVNDGDYDATLTDLVIGPVRCSVNGNESDPSATNVCNNIEYTMKYTINNQNVSINDTLKSKEAKEVQVKLTYKAFSDSSKLPTSNVTISNLGIDMVYTADSEAKTNDDGSTPWVDPYSIGTEINLLNEKYNVIGQGSDYVTLLKQQPLTVSEVNLYGGVETVYNQNGYGGVAYYSSSTCGDSNGNYIISGCTTAYDDSEVKYVVDAWAVGKFTNELKEVDGYNVRLVEKEEIRTIGYPSCSSTSTSCVKESTTPSWLYNSNYWYWTMSQYRNSSADVWTVSSNGRLSGDYYRVFGNDGVVRPVINVYKSAIQS